eukprot:CAMPEP_0181393686 /NCGR_PEP_ID=MMETSP1106-20121128/27330_1 /TAXON_ID=81844 /ORGANISM="Mantoniella antarctica, Strain SL-175" /LENGTH=82 /DNA_ID=CAMNT_0023515039 /DNA_START=496 /DNA_END=744 /DNA_ORIENTATION=-
MGMLVVCFVVVALSELTRAKRKHSPAAHTHHLGQNLHTRLDLVPARHLHEAEVLKEAPVHQHVRQRRAVLERHQLSFEDVLL